jgi:hypothetical protein
VITKSEFEEWQLHPTTKELFKHISEQVEQAKEALATDAGTNPLADRDLVGGIAAFREVLDWVPEFPTEE